MMESRRLLPLVLACSFAIVSTRASSAALGDVDPFFNPSLNGNISAIVAQPDGKVLIAGSLTEVNGTDRPGFARLHADGTLDTSFIPPKSFRDAINGLTRMARS